MTVQEAYTTLQEYDHKREVLRRLISIKTSDKVGRVKPEHIAPMDVIKCVSKVTRIPTDAIKGKRRDREVKNARGIAVYIMCKDLGFSLDRAGESVNRTHATIINAIKRIEEEKFMYRNTKTDHFGVVTQLKDSQILVKAL